MIKGIYQSCYTNTETDGWKSVAVSAELPQVANDYCQNIHGKNSHIDNTEIDEKGGALNLFECDSDGDYLYMTHSQYGLVSRDRPNVFSHTYIFPWNEEMITDPGKFLRFAASNYHDNVQAALEEHEKPDLLEAFSLKEIISKYNISTDNLILYIGAIINQFTKKKVERMPLYIQYDGSEIQYKELLYLAYSLTPRFMRKQINAASCESSHSREAALIFSIKASTKHLYVDLFSGKSNALDETGIKRLKKNGYPVYAIINLDSKDPQEYFKELEGITFKLTGRAEAKRLELLVAHKICTGPAIEELNDDSAIDMFYDVLDIDSDTEFYLDYLAKCLKRVVDCNHNLNEPTQNVLATIVALDKRSDSELKKVYLDFQVANLASKDHKGAVEYLHSLDNDLAKSISKVFITKYNDDEHKKIVEDYYKQYRLKTNTFDSLSAVITEILSIDCLVNKDLKEYLRKKASECYTTYIFNADISFFEKYKEILKQLYSDNEPNRMVAEAKIDFWERISFKNVKFDKKEFYSFMAESCETDKSRLFLKYVTLPDYYKNEGVTSYIENTFAFFNCDDYVMLYSAQGREEAVDALVRYLSKLTDAGVERVRCFTYIASVETSFEQAVNDIAEVLDMSEKNADFTALIEHCKDIDDTISQCVTNKGPFVSPDTSANKSILKQNTYTAIVSQLKDRERNGETVPLDLWLYIGCVSDFFGNPFIILEREHPRILSEDPERVVAESKCLAENSFNGRAQNYTTGKNDDNVVSIVKKWLRIQQNGGKDQPDEDVSEQSTSSYSGFTEPETNSVFVQPATEPAKPEIETPSESTQDDKKPQKGLGGLFGGIFRKG